MANRLRFRMIPYASPGDVELKYATTVGSKTATIAHFLEEAKLEAHEESGFLKCELAANTEAPSGVTAVAISGSKAETYLLNLSQIQDVVEY